jgi:hypothetical protein
MMFVSQKKHLWAFTVCYENSFTFLYADGVRVSQETHVWASTAYYEESFTFLNVDDIHASHETLL